MPSRDERPVRGQAQGRPARAGRVDEERTTRVAPQRGTTPVSGDDVWDTIDSMKAKGGGGGQDGFNKLNTNFFLRDGEEAEIIFIDENPTVFIGHSIKCTTSEGKTFYRIEQCQKSEQDYCNMCDMATGKKSPVGKATNIIAFRILDSRGSWDSQKKDFDGNPAPKIFLSPIYLAKQIKSLKDEGDGSISDKVIKIKKDGNYTVSHKTTKLAGGGFDYEYVDDKIFDDMPLPEILEVYAPLPDDELLEFIDEFSAVETPTRNESATTGTGRAVGTFGGSTTGRRGR